MTDIIPFVNPGSVVGDIAGDTPCVTVIPFVHPGGIVGDIAGKYSTTAGDTVIFSVIVGGDTVLFAVIFAVAFILTVSAVTPLES